MADRFTIQAFAKLAPTEVHHNYEHFIGNSTATTGWYFTLGGIGSVEFGGVYPGTTSYVTAVAATQRRRNRR